MAEEARIGVIGVGQIGKFDLENYRKIPQARVFALADVNGQEFARAASANGITDTSFPRSL